MQSEPLHPILIPVPLTRQATGYTCGVAALQSVLHYFGHRVREDRLAEMLQAGPIHGTDYREMAAYARRQGIEVHIHLGMSLDQLRAAVDDGTPTIVALQAWAEPGTDYAQAWEEGHYVVVVGYDAHNVYFMDPSTLGNYTYLPGPEFLERWHDYYEEDGQRVRLDQFGMTLRGPQPIYSPGAILPMG